MAKSAPKAAAFNVFDIAPPLKAIVKTAKGKVKPAFTLAGLDAYAQIKTVIAAGEALAQEHRATMDPILYGYFADEGCKIARKPENPDGNGPEGVGFGSLELRKRSTTSVLTPEEQAFLAEHNVPTETVVTKQATFIINPKFLTDVALMSKVGEALAALGVPVDMANPENSFIIRQAEESKVVVSDETIAATYKLNPEVAREILPMVTSLGIRAKLALGVGLDVALETFVKELQGNPEVVMEAVADPSKLSRKVEESAKRKSSRKTA